MKAIIQKKYGGPEMLVVAEVERPKHDDKSVVIEVCVANIASGDMRVNTLDVPFGLKTIMRLVMGWNGPRKHIRGITGSGIVVETGKEVSKYSNGDRVYFINSMKAGAMAEYISLPEKSIMAKIPNNISFEEAAPVAFGAMSALHFINEKNIKRNDKVLILGASGSVGTYAVQLAKYYGGEVTAVCSQKNHSIVQEIGADHMIDYTQIDISKLTKKYNVVFDAVGFYKKKNLKNLLLHKGKYLSIKLPTSEKVEKLNELNKIIEQGKLKTVIDKVYTMNQFKEAHEHVYSKHKVGNVVITIKN
jgi:NADPH:quinone reductase-like Zn-dependent oxidoreductase